MGAGTEGHMLCYQTLNQQVRCLVLETMKDGDKAFNLPRVIENISHNLNDRRYVAYALAGVGNGHGDIGARVRIGDCILDIDVAGETSCVYYERDEDYCWNPKRKRHADVSVKFVKWVR